MGFTLRYTSKKLAAAKWEEAVRDGYRPTKIRKIKGKYIFSLTK